MLSKVYSNVSMRVNNTMNTARRYWYSFLAMMSTVCMTLTPTLCAENQMNSIMMQMLDIIYTIARFIGIAILVYGIVSWILAMKDENADGQTRAIKYVVVGVALIAVKSFATPIVNSLMGGG